MPLSASGHAARPSFSRSIIMDDLKGRVALVTGASRGIGRDIALALAAAGCSVAVAYNKDKAGGGAARGVVTEAALPGLRARKWGRIIIMSSIAAQTGGVIGPHYAASKAGLIGLAHSYSAMLAKEGNTSNVIAPALIETDMIKDNPAVKPTLIPIGRFGTVDEVSSVAVMLAGN